MIERDIVAQKIKEFQIEEHIKSNLTRSGYSKTKLQRTPLGEKIIVHVSRPGMVVGRQGQNIRKLTADLKEKFNLENPQIEVSEVKNIFLDPSIVAEMIVFSLERFGSQRFKGVMHKTLGNVLDAGALGVEIILSGKLPSARARSWRVYGGYLKKCGDIAVSGVKKTNAIARLKSGIIGVKVSIMPPDIRLPDKILFLDEIEVVSEEAKEEVEKTEEKPEKAKKKTTKKKTEDKKEDKPKTEKKSKAKKTTKKKDEVKVEEISEGKNPSDDAQKAELSEEQSSSDDAQKQNVSDISDKKKAEEPVKELPASEPEKKEEVKEEKTTPAPKPEPEPTKKEKEE